MFESFTDPFRNISECFAEDEVQSVPQDWPARWRRYLVEVIPPSAPEDTRHKCDEHTTEDGSPNHIRVSNLALNKRFVCGRWWMQNALYVMDQLTTPNRIY